MKNKNEINIDEEKEIIKEYLMKIEILEEIIKFGCCIEIIKEIRERAGKKLIAEDGAKEIKKFIDKLVKEYSEDKKSKKCKGVKK